MNIAITHESGEKRVWIRVDVDGSGDFVWFYRDVETAGEAAAIRVGVESAFRSDVACIRRRAYERGRDSMRDKELRVTHFNDCFNSSHVGYNAHAACKETKR